MFNFSLNCQNISKVTIFYIPTRGPGLFAYRHSIHVNLVCISLMTNHVEHLSMCLVAVYASSLEKCLFNLLPSLNSAADSLTEL